MSLRSRAEALLFAAALAAYLFWAAGHGLFAYFTTDDLMNLHNAWMKPADEIVLDSVLYFTAVRPSGEAFYRIIYAVAGFHPLPFRIACFGLLLANVYLVYRFARDLTGSQAAGLLAAIFGAYHARFVDLHCNTGTVYDLLCFAFYFSALVLYVRLRRAGVAIAGRWLALFVVLYVCALNSKEMAATLPIVVVLYELLYQRQGPIRGWFRKDGRGLLWATALTIPYVLNSLALFHSQPLSASRYFGTWSAYLDGLFYTSGWFDAVKVIVLWTLLASVAWALRSTHLKFCFLFILVSMLPLSFLPPRSTYALYIPWAGWAIYAGVLLIELLDRIWKAPRPAIARLVMPGLMLLLLARVHRVQRTWTIPCRTERQEVVRALADSLAAAGKRPAPGSRILFVDDPFGDFTPYFLVRLYYGDSSLDVGRDPGKGPYAMVVEHRDGRWLAR